MGVFAVFYGPFPLGFGLGFVGVGVTLGHGLNGLLGGLFF